MKTIGTGAGAGKVCALCALASRVMDGRSATSLWRWGPYPPACLDRAWPALNAPLERANLDMNLDLSWGLNLGLDPGLNLILSLNPL